MTQIDILTVASSITTVRIKTVLHAVPVRTAKKHKKRKKTKMAKRTGTAVFGGLMSLVGYGYFPIPPSPKEPWPQAKRNKPLRKKKKSKKLIRPNSKRRLVTSLLGLLICQG